MSYLTGYILIPDKRCLTGLRKETFKVKKKNKSAVYAELKEKYPKSRIHFNEPKKVLAGR